MPVACTRTRTCAWVLLLSLSAWVSPAHAHSRIACPTARSQKTGIKTGPCGSQTGDFSGPYTTVGPGPLTILIEESIAHSGAPFTVSLSQDRRDTGGVCVLLDHIPANSQSAPRSVVVFSVGLSGGVLYCFFSSLYFCFTSRPRCFIILCCIQ